MKTMMSPIWKRIAFAGANLLLLPAQASAQEAGPGNQPGEEFEDEDGFELDVGGGAFYNPDYKGSDDYKIMPIPWVSLRYKRGDRYIEIGGPSAKANIIGGGRFEFGPTLNLDMGRDNDVDSLAVRRLGKIKGALMAGAFFSTDIDLGEGSGIQIGAEGAFDTGNINNGKTAKFEIGYRRQVGERSTVITGVSTTWGDKNYMQTYFGVTPAGALASGLPAYAARSGIENVEWSLGLMHRLDERWSIMALANYQRLLGPAADSPIVWKEGSRNQLGFGFAISRKF